MMEIINKYIKGDKVIWLVVLFLALLSIPVIYSTTGSLAYLYQDGNTTYYIIKHSFFLCIGFIFIFIFHKISYKIYFNIALLLLITAGLLLMLTLVFGKSVNEASRWLRIPIVGIDFQTSDFGKFALIVFAARILSIHQETKASLHKAFVIIMTAAGIICTLILPANFSTTLLLFITIWFLMLIGRINHKYLLSIVAVGIIALGLFILILSTAKIDSRIETWKARVENYFSGKDSFQAQQSKIAVATGQWLGKGAGNSTQRNILPHPYSDFVYAIIIEEYGFIIGGIVLILYLIIFFRTILIVKRAERTFPAFLAVGLSLGLIFQALMNMGVNVGILPVTGQPLPLISMGGTSTLFTCLSLGIILNTSKIEAKKTEEEKQQEEQFELKDYPFIAG